MVVPDNWLARYPLRLEPMLFATDLMADFALHDEASVGVIAQVFGR